MEDDMVPGLSNPPWATGLRATAMCLLLLLAMYPVFFMVTTALKDPGQVSDSYFLPVLGSDPLGSFTKAADTIVPLLWSSIVVTIEALVINLVVGYAVAYIAAFHRFRGRDALFSILTVSIMVPGILVFIPTYLLVRDLQLLNTSWAMSLPYAAQTVAITAYLLRSYMRGMPGEVVEAARVDGAGEVRIAARIVLPMAGPIVIAAGVINVLFTWNQFLWPLVVNAGGAKTVPVGLAQIQLAYGNDLPTVMAGYLIAAVPLVVVFAFCLRYLIAGMTSGAIK